MTKREQLDQLNLQVYGNIFLTCLAILYGLIIGATQAEGTAKNTLGGAIMLFAIASLIALALHLNAFLRLRKRYMKG